MENEAMDKKLDVIIGKLDELLTAKRSLPLPPGTGVQVHDDPEPEADPLPVVIDYSDYVNKPATTYHDIVESFKDGPKGFADNIKCNMEKARAFQPAIDFMADWPQYFK